MRCAYEPIWHTMEEVRAENDRKALVAMGLVMWANCMAGNRPPEEFGHVMVLLGNKLDIAPIPDNLEKLAKEILSEKS